MPYGKNNNKNVFCSSKLEKKYYKINNTNVYEKNTIENDINLSKKILLYIYIL